MDALLPAQLPSLAGGRADAEQGFRRTPTTASQLRQKIANVPGDGAYRLEDPLRVVTVYPVRNRHTTDMIMVWVKTEQMAVDGY